jgi:hypothetical protein
MMALFRSSSTTNVKAHRFIEVLNSSRKTSRDLLRTVGALPKGCNSS